MSKYIYEVVDATNDEIYYPIGLFEDAELCKEMIVTSCPHQSISNDGDGAETIEVRRRKVNDWDGQGVCIFSVDREESYYESARKSI